MLMNPESVRPLVYRLDHADITVGTLGDRLGNGFGAYERTKTAA